MFSLSSRRISRPLAFLQIQQQGLHIDLLIFIDLLTPIFRLTREEKEEQKKKEALLSKYGFDVQEVNADGELMLQDNSDGPANGEQRSHFFDSTVHFSDSLFQFEWKRIETLRKLLRRST